MTRLHHAVAALSFISVAVITACSSSADRLLGANVVTGDTVSYGDPAPRLAAIDAFDGKRPSLDITMRQTTVEGQPIYSTLSVTAGRAVLTVDRRADGGGTTIDTLTHVVLVRLIQARIVNNVEVEKERIEVVDPSTVSGAGVYLLMDPACLPALCGRAF
jgi:hypothetical protein